MPEPLTKIERRILDYVVDYLQRNTYQPNIREIGKRFGLKSTKTVSEHLQSLANKGYIERDPSRSRGVKILGLDLRPDTTRVFCYGRIAAGEPALLDEHVTNTFVVDGSLARSGDTFALRVRGDSMNASGIFDGDLVFVAPAAMEEIESGEIIAARIGGEGAIKNFYTRQDEVVLEAANPEYPPILVREVEDFAVLGRVVGLFRRVGQDPSTAPNS